MLHLLIMPAAVADLLLKMLFQQLLKYSQRMHITNIPMIALISVMF
jgi:hypothetical protein